MPTTFVSTTFVVLVGLNSYGALAPVDKSLMPPGSVGPVLFSVDHCNLVRGKMEHPEKYTCQIFTSAKSTAWTYTPEGIRRPYDPSQDNVQPDTSPEHGSGASPAKAPEEQGRSGQLPPTRKPDDVQVGKLEPGNTPVMYPVFYQIVQGYNGTAGPPNKQYGPVSFMRLEDCQAAIATRPNSENYYCLRYESAKAIQWAPPAEVTPQAVPPEPKPDPASITPRPTGIETKPNDVRVGGKQYTKVAGLTWVEREDSFADVSVGPNDLESKDKPTPLSPKTARAAGVPRVPNSSESTPGDTYQSSTRNIPSN